MFFSFLCSFNTPDSPESFLYSKISVNLLNFMAADCLGLDPSSATSLLCIWGELFKLSVPILTHVEMGNASNSFIKLRNKYILLIRSS